MAKYIPLSALVRLLPFLPAKDSKNQELAKMADAILKEPKPREKKENIEARGP